MTSNEPRLQDWARSRVKRIDFDVHFASTEKGKRTLKELFERDNGIFRWFSYLYLYFEHLVTKYDLGRKRWADVLFGRRDAKVTREKERLLVRFPDQMQSWEIRRFEG
jgi:hypothetical protein